MQIITQLLKSTSPDILQGYRSHLNLHLKQIMTQMNKSKIQNISTVEIRKNKCVYECYKKGMNQLRSNKQHGQQTHKQHGQQTSSVSSQQLLLKLQQLKQCKSTCKNQQKQVKKHLDDINFYSKRKFTGCSQKCQKKYQDNIKKSKSNQNTNENNTQYKQQTKNNAENLQNKLVNKSYNDCMWDCYNRLDRRYKVYWKQQQDQIIKAYLG